MDETAKQLSRRIASLEAHLGTRLFYRTTRSVRPTPDGEAWYADVRTVLERLDEATDAISPTHQLQGLVRVQVPTLLSEIVQAWCGRQLAIHPGLSFVLLVGDRSDNLLARGVDLCVSGVPPTGATLLVRKLGSLRSQIMAHTDYLDRRGRPESPSDLIHHDCLRFAGPSPQNHWVLNRSDGLAQTVPIGGRMACNDSRILYRCLLQGFGIGPAPELPEGSPGHRGLERVLPDWSFEAFSLYLVLAPGRSRHPSVRYVADALARIGQDVIEQRGAGDAGHGPLD
ncbi:MAG: LysR family transcriptional regulator [Deltaproteobacteria bacterium]|nr:LysR family transcriptional regulator [Deltaproteobacteria bacterium]